jgi:HAD superfamily hydrolase (TIGR01509 family)
LHTYDAILFDFDGVLVDSEPVHFQCWSEILSDFGLSLQWESWAAECIGVSDRQMLERMSRQVNPPIDVDTLYATYPRKRDRFRQLMEERMPFFEGARELFESLRGYKLALVTSSGRAEVEPVLRKAGLFEYFSATVCFGDVVRIKPAPDPYLKAAELLAAKRPLVVEDSDAGAESGRAAGFDVLRVVTPAEVPDALRKKLEALAKVW